MRVTSRTFDQAAELWEELLLETPGATAFHSPSWHRIWWRHFGRDAQLRLLEIDSGGAFGIAPLMQRAGQVSFLGGTDLVDYHDFVAGVDASENFYRALIDHLNADSSITSVDLTSIPGGSPTLELLPATARAAGWSVRLDLEDVAPSLRLPATWDEYVAGLSKKHRHELRRKLRRLEAAGEVASGELRDPGQIGGAADHFFTLLRNSAPEKAAFLTEERERFFRSIMIELAEEGVARLGYLDLGGRRVAASLCFVFSGGKLLYNSGYDPAFGHLAVGLLNHAYDIRRSIEEGLRCFDFMRGGEAYKYHLGATDRTLHRIVLRRNPS